MIRILWAKLCRSFHQVMHLHGSSTIWIDTTVVYVGCGTCGQIFYVTDNKCHRRCILIALDEWNKNKVEKQ